MNLSPYFLIHGPVIDGEPTFWNNSCKEWTVSENHATMFRENILAEPLPMGAEATTSISEHYPSDSSAIHYSIPSMVERSLKILEKTC